MAARFDIGRLAAEGPAVPVLDIGPQADGSVAFEGTDAGLLAYRSGSPGPSTLVWVDRAGVVTGFAQALRGFAHPRVSPDARRIVAFRDNDLWLYDLARASLSQLTFQGGNIPVWTPDGREVIHGRPRPARDGTFFGNLRTAVAPSRSLWQGHWIKCRAAAIRRGTVSSSRSPSGRSIRPPISISFR